MNLLSSQEVSKNLTKENEQIKEDMEEIRTEMNKRAKENCSDNILDSMPDIRSALQRDAAAAYAHPEVQPQPPKASPYLCGGGDAGVSHLHRVFQGSVLQQSWSHFTCT